MPALFWNSDRRHLSEALANIGELKRVAANGLPELGFSQVNHSQLDVSGGRNGVFVSIAHFPIGGREFFEVVMASGDTGDLAVQARDDVVRMLRNFKFL